MVLAPDMNIPPAACGCPVASQTGLQLSRQHRELHGIPPKDGLQDPPNAHPALRMAPPDGIEMRSDRAFADFATSTMALPTCCGCPGRIIGALRHIGRLSRQRDDEGHQGNQPAHITASRAALAVITGSEYAFTRKRIGSHAIRTGFPDPKAYAAERLPSSPSGTSA